MGTPGRTRSVGDRSGSWIRPRDRARLRARGRRPRRELQRERPRREGGRRRARATRPARRGGAGRRRARGSGARGPFLDVPVADYETMFAINVTGTFLCTQHALRPMVAARYGRIINFSTQLARASVGTGGFAAYAATKGAIEAFTRAMAHEFGPHGVTVNAIAPGGIDTDMSRAVMTPEYRARRIGELPVRHLGQVEDVAYCAVFLAAEEAHYLTGQVLQPNGGWVMT